MQDYFYSLMDYLDGQLQAGEVYLGYFSGEQSEFIRFNRAKVRQPGSVEQRYLELELIEGNRHTTGQLALSGDRAIDEDRVSTLLWELRGQLPHLAEDPYLLYAQTVQSSETVATNQLPNAQDLLDEIISTVANYDFVGLYAGGGIFTGFANSLGQRNWQSSFNFNLDWSFYHDQDKAVKSAYAGFQWNSAEFADKIAQAKQQLEIIKRPARSIAPGNYRVYLSPVALQEIFNLLSWGGFGMKSQRTKESPLLRLLEEPKQRLHPSVTLLENTAAGIAPSFQNKGFIKPPQVVLISQGELQGALVSPRSAKEYEVVTNGANEEETPTALDLAAGTLASTDILSTLEQGIYINNLWYLNYSDRDACRMTGMTRFATFWVEQGEIVAPLKVMRFDETLYHILGDKLMALTAAREFIMEASTYDFRSTNSIRLPGAVVDDFTLTL